MAYEYHVTAYEDLQSLGTRHFETMPTAAVEAITTAQALWFLGLHEIDLQRVDIDRWEIACSEGCKVVLSRVGEPDGPPSIRQRGEPPILAEAER
jgi:hypothetical protein